MNFEVIVKLKKEVLDPEGRAIQETLTRLGEKSVKAVTVSKRYVLEIEGSPQSAEELVGRVAKEYLANPVSETYEVRKL
jgi:phosphoribosylformylglycinamidine synthase PurS subunit